MPQIRSQDFRFPLVAEIRASTKKKPDPWGIRLLIIDAVAFSEKLSGELLTERLA
jgi:hypothetical protein